MEQTKQTTVSPWVNASERPIVSQEGEKIFIKYKGRPDLLINFRGILCWFSDDNRCSKNEFIVNPDSWSAIEWLDESIFTNLQSEVAALKEENRGLFQTTTMQTFELNTLQSENKELSSLLDFSRKELSKSSVKIDTLEDGNQSLQYENTRLKGLNEALTKRYIRIENRKQEQRKNLNDLSAKNTRLLAEVERLTLKK